MNKKQLSKLALMVLATGAMITSTVTLSANTTFESKETYLAGSCGAKGCNSVKNPGNTDTADTYSAPNAPQSNENYYNQYSQYSNFTNPNTNEISQGAAPDVNTMPGANGSGTQVYQTPAANTTSGYSSTTNTGTTGYQTPKTGQGSCGSMKPNR